MMELDSSVERAESQQAEAQRTWLGANFERAKELRRSNAGTQRSLDESKSAMQTADAAVDLAKARLDKRTLVAPFDGVAGLRNGEPGRVRRGGDRHRERRADRSRSRSISASPSCSSQPWRLDSASQLSHRRLSWAVVHGRGQGDSTRWSMRPGGPSCVRAEIGNDEKKLRPGLFARVTL